MVKRKLQWPIIYKLFLCLGTKKTRTRKRENVYTKEIWLYENVSYKTLLATPFSLAGMSSAADAGGGVWL